MTRLKKPRNLRSIHVSCCEHCKWLEFYADNSDVHKCLRPDGPEFDIDFDPFAPYYNVCDLYKVRK